jgi:hypothetical protein
VRRILLTLILAIVMLAVSVSPALAQVVVSPSQVSPSSAEPCPYTGPVAAEIFKFVNLTPCDVQVVND